MNQIIVKRILSWIVAIAILLSIVPINALATTTDIVQDTQTVQTEEVDGENTGETEGNPDEVPDDTLEELPDEVPGGDNDNSDTEVDIDNIAVDVFSADELTLMLSEGQRAIRIAEDFIIDRTFYVTADTVIFTDTNRTLTRASDFGGDIFVIGENAEGNLCENGVTLTLGHPESTDKDMLAIDGNKNNMTVDVTGSVLFVVCGSDVELYENVTISNHKKVGNEKTLTEKYGVSYVGRVGGAVAIISQSASMTIYGGTYIGNAVNDITDSSTEEGQVSSQGGAFYNFGTLEVYGGLFQNNHAGRGGVFYCYRTIRIYNAQILNNTSSTYGGAIYMPSSTSAKLFIGGENHYTDSRVLFKGNTAVNTGGAIYSRNLLEIKDTQFIENSSTESSGGAISGGEMQLVIENTSFDGNIAAKYGGAIYYAGANGKEDVYDITCIGVTFTNNSVSATAGALYMNGAATATMEDVEFSGNKASNFGGAIYLNDGHVNISGATLTQNTANSGGVAYLTNGSDIDINGGSITDNSCKANGGALGATDNSSIRLNQITGSKNTAKLGGFSYCEETSALYIYDSTLQENSSTGNGGAVHMVTYSYGGIYNTTFHKNTSGSSGGALYIYTSGYDAGSKVVLHSCTYTNNEAVYGGAIYTAKQSVIDLLNSIAKYNHAERGGFMYHTAYNTTVNVASLTLEGNTATSGPIIYGNTYNATLNIDKAIYIDKDYTGTFDDAYWAAVFANLLTVKEIVLDVPNYIGYDGTEVVPVVPRIPVGISSADELEQALESGKDLLYITADFTLDRTFYIWRNTTIYTTEAHTLTRAQDFGGDLFVVGERSAGNKCEKITNLQLGNPESTENNLLIIDGNKENMTVDVTGSMLFVVDGHSAQLYPNLTAINHKKVGNQKLLTGDYTVSYALRVGGSVAILAGYSTMDIFGGIYSYNETLDITDSSTDEGQVSTHGGAFYNYGTLNVYGGMFENNHSAKGSVFYCYRTTNIYNATIRNNTASNLGGAIYMPNSTAAFLYLGGENEYSESNVVFQNNSATSSGGAIYAKNKLVARDTKFIGNSSAVSGGAIYTGEMELVTIDTVFEDNTAKKYGGAIYFSGENGKEGITELTCINTRFTRNSASATGGAIYLNTNATAQMNNVEFNSNTATNNGGGIYLNNGHVDIIDGTLTANSATVGGFAALTNGSTIEVNGGSFTENSSTGNGGALNLLSSSSAVLNKTTATENSSASGGFAYVSEATITVYRSKFLSNTTSGNGGAIYAHTSACANIYGSEFTGNTTTGTSTNGGALALYTGGTEVLVQECTFTNNNTKNFGGALWISGKTIAKLYNITAKNNNAAYGGFMYETAAGTVVTLAGTTVSGNTASKGGPIIYGNTYNAILNLDKNNFVDENHSEALDNTYWASAIVNKLTVNDYNGEIPKWLDYKEESYENMADAVDVSSADELEAAINSGVAHIRVITDFTLDRTFYITSKTTIFSTLPRTLTRAENFGGEIFVVGENADGKSALLLGSTAKLILGNPLSTQKDLLTIDGNKDNMQVPVKGSVIFLCYSGTAELYTNVTAKNMNKTANEKTFNEAYNVPIANRVGGNLATVASGTLSIYGGIYRDNLANEEDTSSEETRISCLGGLIFNNGNVYIYDGMFENNQAARGGVVYNYKILKIYGGNFIGNTATISGGAFYSPNSAASHTHIGSDDANSTQVLFQNNTSQSNGGAIASSALCTLVIHGNTSFIGNASESSGGAISVYGQLTVRDVLFEGNTAKNMGGAVYTANSNNNYVTRHTSLENCTFESNSAPRGGALSVYSSNSDFDNGAIASVTDCTFTNNAATSTTSKTAACYGGAIYVERKSTLRASGSTFSKNEARTEGGAIYAGGASSVSLSDIDFTNNLVQEKGKQGGAVSLHSVTLDASDVNFKGNSAPVRAGALYISYASAHDRNSEVFLKGSNFTNNTTEGMGGAIYVTKQTVTEEKRILTVDTTSFDGNTALNGGAIYLASGTSAYMTDTTFTENKAIDEDNAGIGGAIVNSGGNLELDGATFTGNTSTGGGAAIYLTGQSTTVLNGITATSNVSEGSGGFLYADDCTLTMYDSLIKSNTANNNGGGMALFSGATANIYATDFTQNISIANGGGVFLYTNLAPNILHSCTFNGNSGVYGGAIYASGKAIASLYNTVARNNTSSKGGFLYHTTTATELTLAGVTVSGNTASSGGPIIWGNSTGAVLHLNKNLWTDEDQTGTLGDAYWATAIVNKLTVEEGSATVPDYDPYVSKRNEETEPPAIKKPVPVSELFELSKNSSDASINSTYNKLPRLDNSRNFMSQNVTTFENINGGTVTVDTFVYPEKGVADNCNVGMGLMLWQAMCYKQANPNEEVYVDISYYRFSVQAAVNINRNSRYFGYMRQLSGTKNYDEYGFVRIAYLLISAAKMGIHVTAIGHIDGYPVSADSLNLNDYFTSQLSDPCDPAYVENGIISDYMDFCQVDWSLDQKGGTDMMHTKLCAVSHYLDMNGVVHKNAVWTGSTNLDGITATGYNANWKMQTATIVTNHEEIYRASVNYLRTITLYPGQEDVYDFQNRINRLSTEQSQLILSGRENEIPADEQIIYLGNENDQVFELYFTPMGGDILAWDEVHNPYCKYMRKLYNSEDYILFTWNAAEYSSGFVFGDQLESMLIAAFHDNKNPNNRIYGMMENFDASAFKDLEIGVDIGFKSFNSYDFGQVHNKDVQFSYVENGQRYYVSLLNSMNFHSGSMYYQSNFALVIKETECKESSVFFTLADKSTTGIVEHDYGEEQHFLPEDETLDGYTYKKCQQCDKEIVTGVKHREGDWIIDREATADKDGIRHRECLVCGKMSDSSTFTYGALDPVEHMQSSGRTFTADSRHIIKMSENIMPSTFEATVQVSPNITGRAGVILSNYEKFEKSTFFLEVYNGGKIRLYFVNDHKYVNHIFSTDIRSEDAKHIALTVDGTTALLYVDGKLMETAEFSQPLPELQRDFMIGSDYRPDNTQFFKGKIYSVNLFSDIRTAEEIQGDRIVVADNADALLYSEQLFEEAKDAPVYTAVAPVAKTFNENTSHLVNKTFSDGVKTFEATILVPKDSDNAGVILGNYGMANGAQMFLDIYTGRLRLYYITEDGQTAEVIISESIRSNIPIHIAVSIDGNTVTTYINGEKSYTTELTVPLPKLTEGFVIGGDNREGNTQYFKGSIYSVNLFSDVRTQEEIRNDMLIVPSTEDNLLYSTYFVIDSKACKETEFTSGNSYKVEKELSSTPYTFEAVVQVPKKMVERAGVIVGNYDGSLDAQVNLEVYYNGRLRLFYKRQGLQKASCLFNTDIRSDEAVHIAVTISNNTATLYVNGKKAETVALTLTYPSITTGFVIGGDNRPANEHYFKGNIYSVSLFDHARTPEQILMDVTSVPETTEGLLLNKHFGNAFSVPVTSVVDIDGKKFDETNSELVAPQLASAPKTIEAIVNVPLGTVSRSGVIVGNYDNTGRAQINLEVHYNGHARLYLNNGTAKQTVLFKSDIRSNGPVHLAVTLEESLATLYVNGVAVETATLNIAIPNALHKFLVGGDNREGNSQYFKGTIYAVNMFDHVRTSEQIQQDTIFVPSDAEGLLYSGHYRAKEADLAVWASDGKTFTAETPEKLPSILPAAAKTLEAIVNVPLSYKDRAGVIVGNYDNSKRDQLNLEIYSNGKVRLFLNNGSQKQTVLFNTDIRSDVPVYLAVTLEDTLATLYIDGIAVETAVLSIALPNATDNLLVGGDNREDNSQYFKGTIYAVSIFDHIRTPQQIITDNASVSKDTLGVLYSSTYTTYKMISSIPVTSGATFTPDRCLDVSQPMGAAPQTIEATLRLPKSVSDYGGTIIGNYGSNSTNLLTLEVCANGKLRLYGQSADVQTECVFNTDIRSDAAIHIAVTVADGSALLYVNGVFVEQMKLNTEVLTATENFRIGGDNREGNTHFFKGTIYSVYMFSNVRSAQQIQEDAISAPSENEELIFSKKFDADSICTENTADFNHVEGEWILDRAPNESQNGLMHSTCSLCGKILRISQTRINTDNAFWQDLSKATGLTPTAPRPTLPEALTTMPKTYEFTLQMPTNYVSRGGVVLGNYNGGNGNFMNVEIYYNGKPRLWFKIGNTSYSCLFKTDIRSNDPIHVAITVDGYNASLYVNGVFKETITMTKAIPETLSDYRIGADSRQDNTLPFVGTIYSVNLFDHVRTEEQIAIDAILTSPNESGLIYNHYFNDLVVAEQK